MPVFGAVVRPVAAVVFAVVVGLLLVEGLLRPPADDLRALGMYMLGSAITTMIVGGVAVRLFDRAGVIGLRPKIAFGAVVGACVGLLNVLIVSKLMFVSTAHDLRLLAALIGFSALVSLTFSGWVASRVTAQVEVLSRRIRSLATGDYATRLSPIGADEISRQARDLDELASLLQTAAEARARIDQERRDLTIAISHDLRTPLGSIRAMAEALTDGVVHDTAEVARYHLAIRGEVDRLAGMVDDLFQISQIDAGVLPLDRQRVALQEIAAEVTDAMQARAAVAGIALALTVTEALPLIAVDGALVERAVGNLIANAIEHTPRGGHIEVAVMSIDQVQRLTVTDTGPGIEPTHRDRVWDAFFRVDPSRNRALGQSQGAGLGLAIVRGVAEAHGGRVTLDSTLGQGSTFAIELPAAP